ncbi:MAG: sugar nucleotide-binding protein, partial [Alphaproteobacteria bacterium]|nr:sugar nucleotide-binding protein [Alphaproteobacteria bacterium]
RVFDGIRSDYCADDGRTPTTEYGRQMAEIEDRILDLGGLGTVLRLTKVLSHDDVLLFGWLQTLAVGGKIEAANDMVMAPITADLAVRILVELGAMGAQGIFQMSANRDLTYLEVAWKLAAAVGASDTAVESVPHSVLAGLSDVANVPGFAPSHSTLDSTRIGKIIGIPRPSPEEAIVGVIDDWRGLEHP